VNRESLLVATLVELADSLVDNFDVIDVLTLLSDRCVEAVDVDAAGVMLRSPAGELEYVASSSDTMRVLELFQIQADEGPCVDCMRDGFAIVNRELVAPDARWPRLPMRLRGQTIGALNLFRTELGFLDDDDVVVAQALADVATIAILQHQSSLAAVKLNEQLSWALNSRIIIEQAKGMVSESMKCDMDDAFAKLRAHARNRNLGLTNVATSVVSGALDPHDLDSPKRKTQH